MFCVKCGTEIGNDVNFCPKCGFATNQTSETIKKTAVRERSGFTFFWLIFSMLDYIITIFAIIILQIPYRIYSGDLNLFFLIIILSTIIPGIIGNILLLCWKKIGFWLLTGSYIISLPLIFMNIPSSLVFFNYKALYGILLIVIMFVVLRLKKNRLVR